MNIENQQKILIVDDSSDIIQIINDILEKDYEVFFAITGKKAINIALTENPDLILLDVMMPDMNGYEVCRKLKSYKQFHHIPIIFLTAMNDIEDETKGLELGAIDYITKPFNPAIVKVRIKNHLELKRQRDILENLSSRDGLTGIANRRRFDEFLDQEWLRAKRKNTQLSLIMMDVDHFKQYNDNYGHLAGDDCLKQIASTLEKQLKRPTDLVTRYGGEEFASILPDTNNEGALHIAKQFIESISELKIPHSHSSVDDHVTISIGVATITPSDLFFKEQLIKAADSSLYKAKEAGRNKVKGREIK
jgi:diguanylate cyclase (GGDEF)-like protein